MMICIRCATHLKAGLTKCPRCGATALASIQREQDPPAPDSPAERPPPHWTPKIKQRAIRSPLSQQAGACGGFAAAAVCFFAALCGSPGGPWYGRLIGGCLTLACVAPCAVLLGVVIFSMLAESLQVLLRPVLDAADPEVRKALQHLQRHNEAGQASGEALKEMDAQRMDEDGIAKGPGFGAVIPLPPTDDHMRKNDPQQ